MATRRQCINKANSLVGVKEGAQADKLVIAPWNRATGCHASSKKNPWCAIFVASVLIQIKGKGYSKSATCKNQKAYYKKNKRWREAGTRPNNGEVIFITGHEGIVVYTKADGTGYYDSGNCANAVRKSKFNWKTKKTASKKKIQGYGKPLYT